ncbi:hypothetical protein [Bacillus weihaiensis]|uniref:hypothetical protein n=1 Tax=Bacillus weihaiensis TaxID=1547283 RepID=UPI00235267A6|nr:hypothetical protein [Bacillus weihaiensis]
MTNTTIEVKPIKNTALNSALFILSPRFKLLIKIIIHTAETIEIMTNSYHDRSISPYVIVAGFNAKHYEDSLKHTYLLYHSYLL